ncbi:MAG TPA: hypothetical protein V6D17_14300 [Candidatus Obscuribacterales bacterium]
MSIEEVEECFLNRTKGFLEDTRTDHLTEPPTRWFISRTDRGRVLKVVFIEQPGQVYELKTAFEPSADEERIYDKYAQTI